MKPTVVLVPGVTGIDLTFSLPARFYWRGWEQHLADAGYDVLVAWQPPAGGLDACADALKFQTRHLERMHLVGHSRGGMVVRMLAEAGRTLTVTSVSGCHRGQYLIDILAMIPEVASTPDAAMLYSLVGADPEKMDLGDIIRDGTMKAIYEFNVATPNVDGCTYCDVRGSLGYQRPSLPLELSALLIQKVGLNVIVLEQRMRDLRRKWQDFHEAKYSEQTDAIDHPYSNPDRHHDGAVYTQAGANPWGTAWASSSVPIDKVWPLNHLQQPGIEQDARLPELVAEFIHTVLDTNA